MRINQPALVRLGYGPGGNSGAGEEILLEAVSEQV